MISVIQDISAGGTKVVKLPLLTYRQILKVAGAGNVMYLRAPNDLIDSVETSLQSFFKQSNSPLGSISNENTYVIRTSQSVVGSELFCTIKIGPTVVEGATYKVYGYHNGPAIIYIAQPGDTPSDIATAFELLINDAFFPVPSTVAISSGDEINIVQDFLKDIQLTWFNGDVSGSGGSLWQRGYYVTIPVLGTIKKYIVYYQESTSGDFSLPAPGTSYDYEDLTEFTDLAGYLYRAGYITSLYSPSSFSPPSTTIENVPGAGVSPDANDVIYDETTGDLIYQNELNTGFLTKVLYRDKI